MFWVCKQLGGVLGVQAVVAAHLLGVKCVVGEINLGKRGHGKARKHSALGSNCIKAGTQKHFTSGEWEWDKSWGVGSDFALVIEKVELLFSELDSPLLDI